MPKRRARRQREGEPGRPERPGWPDAHHERGDRADGRRSQIPPSPAKGAFTPHARRAPRH